MATLATASEKWLANEWEKVYKTAVLSGIVGDLAHKARGGYHISRQDQGSGNYSVIRADDKGGPSDRAAAIDMTMSTADMKKCHVRLRDIWKNRSKDPRMKYINAWNGWDGEGDAGRYDVVKGTISFASADHKWHIHLEIRRKYVNDMTAMRAILSMLKGESLATYQGDKAPVTAKPTPVKDDDGMADITPERFNELFLGAINNDKVAAQLKARAWQYVGGGIDPGKSTLGVFNEIHQLTKALAATIAAESTNPAELQAALDGLPTAGENADAVVEALGGLEPEQLADILVGILGPEKVAALKAAL
jgi:hypothetical protein